MGSINLDRVRHLLGSITEAESRLRELGKLSEEEFLADFRNVVQLSSLDPQRARVE